jgi:hypothetical protein
MFVNLHTAGFLQGSIYPRNILIQSGPLTRPLSERSLATPSFRIIDFGRAQYKLHYIRDAVGVAAWEQYTGWLGDYDDFINTVGAAEAEKEYTITVDDDEDEDENEDEDREADHEKGKGKGKGKGKAKGREVKMVMGLEKGKWTQLCTAWFEWSKLVMEADGRVQMTMGAGYRENMASKPGQ